jgi:cellulose synthase (UDP-forming)
MQAITPQHQVGPSPSARGHDNCRRVEKRRFGSVALLLTLLHALAFEAVLLCFGRTDTTAEFLPWLGMVTLQLVVIWHTSVTWLTTRGRDPAPLPSSEWWSGSIDVFVTVCGEPIDMLIPVIRAARDMDLTHDTWVLDDGPSRELRDWCHAEGVGYFSRPSRKHGKAGNVNFALARTQGELVAIFDADHRPHRTFLRQTVGHFADEKLAFVQTPQSYAARRTLVSRGAREAQYPFYKHVMPGKARQGTAICVGTNVVFRRAALEQIGGVYRGSQTEDVHTSLRLHNLGWRSIFVSEHLARGLPPEDWRAYLGQQRRWARGAFEVLLSAHLWKRSKLNSRQRLQYSMLGTHYLSSIIFLPMSVLPGIYLLWRVSPLSVDPAVPLGLMFSAIVTITLANRIQDGSYGIAGAIAHAVASPAHVMGLLDALTRRNVDWEPTHGAVTSRRPALSHTAFRGAIVIVNLAAVIVGTVIGLARLGHARPAAVLGLAAADDSWVFATMAWCSAMALMFLLPSIRRYRIAQVSWQVRWLAMATCCTVVVLAATQFSSTPYAQPSRPTGPMVWREDFSGPAGAQPSEQDWIFSTGHHYPGGPPNWGTGEIQEYTRSPDNLRTDGAGNLEITATVDRDGDYRSARIETRRSDFSPPVGGTLRIQARVKLPAARGSWATFWALGSSFRTDLRWPESGEIDAIEYRGSRPDEVYGVLHCPQCGEPVGKRSRYQDHAGLANDFHTYTVDWRTQPDRMDWYVDGHLYQSISREMMSEQSWAFDQPVFLLLNLAVGGDWPGPPHESDYPATLKVDYIEARSCLGDCPPLR